jgi:hypothetical protein
VSDVFGDLGAGVQRAVRPRYARSVSGEGSHEADPLEPPVPPRHLIHVGFPKAASTSLQAWFGARPDVVFTNNGLLGYYEATAFAHDAARGRRATLYVTSYEHLIAPGAPNGGFIDSSEPARVQRQRICKLLRDLFADATILIVTRGFRGTIASGFSQFVRSGGTVDGWAAFLNHSEAGSFRVQETWDYDASIAEYEQAFGADRVVVLPFELLVDDPDAFQTVVEDRLGLLHLDLPLPRLNLSLTNAELRWYPRFARLALFAASRLGRPGRRLRRIYLSGVGHPDLRSLASALDRVLPGSPPDPLSVAPAGMLEGWGSRSVELRRRPEFRRYGAHYGG